MKIFVSEYLCSGAWPDSLDNSLALEGKSMLLAVLDDVSRLPGVEVYTSWDVRLGEFPLPHVSAFLVDHPDKEAIFFRRMASEADGTVVIAPETGGLLRARRREVVEAGGTFCGSSDVLIQLAGDKHATAVFFRHYGIDCLPSMPFAGQPPERFPVVIKPRDGAGSQHTYQISDLATFHFVVAELPKNQEFLVQPYQPGEAWSVVCCEFEGGFVIFPPARQHLSEDGRFRYLGGTISNPPKLSPRRQQNLNEMIHALRRKMPMEGYLGMDLIFPPRSDAPVLVELNPRLTTSYLGYRALSRTNLARLLLGPLMSGVEPEWISRTVSYFPDGRCEVR